MALRTNFAVKPTLTGELVLLRPVAVADAAGLLACDDETLRRTGSHQKADGLGELEQWYATRAAHSSCRSTTSTRAPGTSVTWPAWPA